MVYFSRLFHVFFWQNTQIGVHFCLKSLSYGRNIGDCYCKFCVFGIYVNNASLGEINISEGIVATLARSGHAHVETELSRNLCRLVGHTRFGLLVIGAADYYIGGFV